MERHRLGRRGGATLALLLLGSLVGAEPGAAQSKAAPEEWLGMVVRDLDAEAARQLGAGAGAQGVAVDAVDVDGPADAAGIEAGDVITHVDERSIADRAAFLHAVERRQPGDRLRLRGRRDGRERRFTVELGGDGHGGLEPAPEWSDVGALQRSGVQLGVQCVDLENPELAAYFGVRAGVLVTDIVSGSGAAAAGVQGGDVILGVAGRDVDDVAALRRELRRFDAGDEVDLRLRRSGQERTLRVGLQRDPGGFMALKLPRVERWRGGDDAGELRRELEALRRDLQRLEHEWKEQRR